MSGSNVIPFCSRAGLKFGVYLGGVAETRHELATGKPDMPNEINLALETLQGERQFLVRTYLRYTGTQQDRELTGMPGMPELARYTWHGRKLDLVLSNWDGSGNLNGWLEFIENVIERYGAYVGCLQICEEPNLFDYPGDGRFGYSVDAVILGVKLARKILRQRALSATIGFNAIPSDGTQDAFWRGMLSKVDDAFVNSLDYVGLNFYPDTSQPLIGDMATEVAATLAEFREVNLARVGIPGAVPIHITENGWPTGPFRYYTRQADLLEQMVRAIYDLRGHLNITHYELFSLRDADTANPDLSHQFGILKDDYSEKPAFQVYRKLIAELGI